MRKVSRINFETKTGILIREIASFYSAEKESDLLKFIQTPILFITTCFSHKQSPFALDSYYMDPFNVQFADSFHAIRIQF